MELTPSSFRMPRFKRIRSIESLTGKFHQYPEPLPAFVLQDLGNDDQRNRRYKLVALTKGAFESGRAGAAGFQGDFTDIPVKLTGQIPAVTHRGIPSPGA